MCCCVWGGGGGEGADVAVYVGMSKEREQCRMWTVHISQTMCGLGGFGRIWDMKEIGRSRPEGGEICTP